VGWTRSGCTIWKRVLIRGISEDQQRGSTTWTVKGSSLRLGHVLMNMSGYTLSTKMSSRDEMFAYAFGRRYPLTLTP
jgi:hypothetical protein